MVDGRGVGAWRVACAWRMLIALSLSLLRHAMPGQHGAQGRVRPDRTPTVALVGKRPTVVPRGVWDALMRPSAAPG